MNAAYGITVNWLEELSPTTDAQRAAREIFVQQVSAEPSFYRDDDRGVWGWVNADAALLFKVPR